MYHSRVFLSSCIVPYPPPKETSQLLKENPSAAVIVPQPCISFKGEFYEGVIRKWSM
nr:MAG TPA: hypothetical protein [Caudoviricetes sp.]